MSGRVQDKLIVVTGAGRGQGEAEAARLAAEGATVIACDLPDASQPGAGPAGPAPGPLRSLVVRARVLPISCSVLTD